MGDIFLKLFIRKLEELFKLELNLDYGDAKIVCEKYIGLKTKDKEGKDIGGRIDIYISDNTNHIAIENKIYEVMIRGNKFEKGTYTCDRSKRRC